MRNNDDPQEALVRVSRFIRRRDMESEDWQKAVAINGLLATGREEDAKAAEQLVDRSIETQTSEGQFSYGSLDYKPWLEHTDWSQYKGIADPTAIGHSVVELLDRTGDDRYRRAGAKQLKFLRALDRLDGGFPHRRSHRELWVDSIYMIAPFLSSFGRVTDDERALDDAVDHIRACTRHLRDPNTGLFRHIWREQPNSYPKSAFWSRGNGWALAGTLDTLEHLTSGHEGREDLIDTVRLLAASVLEYQDESGFWHHILDDPESPLETSGTLMYVYSFLRGLDMGILTDSEFESAARRAFDVCTGLVDEDGAVHRVAQPPGGLDVPFGVTSFGQGWFLLAATAID